MGDNGREYTLVEAYSTSKIVVFAVDPSRWKPAELSLETTNVTAWGPDVCAYECKLIPHSSVYFRRLADNVSQILGVSTSFEDTDDKARGNARHAICEFTRFKAPVVGLSPSPATPMTLHDLLVVLLNDAVCSSEQQVQITALVYKYLRSELDVNCVFSSLSGIVGYTTIQAIVRNYQESDRQFSPSDVLTYVKKSNVLPDLLSLPRDEVPPRSILNTYPPPRYFFRDIQELDNYFARQERVSEAVKSVSVHSLNPWLSEVEMRNLNDRVGHTTVSLFDNLFLQIGGMFQIGREYIGNGWETLAVIEKQNWKCFNHNLLGSAPPIDTIGPAVAFARRDHPFGSFYVFGGTKSLELLLLALTGDSVRIKQTKVTNSLFILDNAKLVWEAIQPVDSSTLTPRAFSMPMTINRDGVDAGLVIYGGFGPHGEVLKTASFYDLATRCWSPVTGPPLPARAGAAVTTFGCIEDSTFLCSGGFREDLSVGREVFVISFKFEGDVCTVSSVREVPSSAALPGRALHSAALVTTKGCSFEVASNRQPNPTTEIEKTFLLYSGGAEPEGMTVSVIELFVSADGSVMNALPISQPEVQKCPVSTSPTNWLPRMCGTSIAFNMLVPETDSIAPAFFASGGLTTRKYVPHERPQCEGSACLVMLHPIDPFHAFSPRAIGETPSVSRQRLHETSDGISRLGMSAGRKRHHGTVLDEPLAKAYSQMLHQQCSWESKFSWCADTFFSLGSLIRNPFTAIGNMIANSCVMTNRARNCVISFASNDRCELLLLIQDDGRGMSYCTFNAALKRFGIADGTSTLRDARINSGGAHGLGLKFSAGKLCNNLLCISRTADLLSLGLLSKDFLSDSGAQNVVAPTCFWKLPEKYLVNTESEHAANQEQIIKYSPFKTLRCLADTINRTGKMTGTTMIFCDLEASADILLDAHDGVARSSNAVITPWRQSLLASTVDSFPTDNNAHVIPITNGVSALKHGEGPIWLVPSAPASDYEVDSSNPVFTAHLREENTMQDVNPDFPFYKRGCDSIDCCLPTYVFWHQMFNVVQLWYGTRSCSAPDARSAPGHDVMYNTLYRFLKRRLFAMAELEFLFTPEDSLENAFGLLGFVNDPSSTNRPLCEMGILLYHNERLIKRLFVPLGARARIHDEHANGNAVLKMAPDKKVMFPCTCIINVPDSLLPIATYEEFSYGGCERENALNARIKKLVTDYLNVATDPEALQRWITTRNEDFIHEMAKRRPLNPILHATIVKRS